MLRRFLIVALILAFGFLGALQVPRLGGRYMLQESDHTDVMMSGRTAQTQRTIRIVFVGNSFTFTNDLPAMVVNIAASDAGNTTELAVKAFTREDAHLGDLLLHSDALAWIRANPVDYVVLQDHSGWYSIPEWTEQAHRDAHAWRDALQPLNAKPVLFELWADSEGSDLYASPNYYAYGGNFGRRHPTPNAAAMPWHRSSASRSSGSRVRFMTRFSPDRRRPSIRRTSTIRAAPAPISSRSPSIASLPGVPAPRPPIVPGA